VLSKQAVYSRLADHFIGLRFDWEQGNHYKEKFGFILGTGDQLLLTPEGGLIRPSKADQQGRATVLFGRHGCDTTADVLDEVIRQHPASNQVLKLEWFLWKQNPTRRPGGFYPASSTAIAGYARLPYVIVEGPLPAALEDAGFLRWHVRQFIWTRGQTNGQSRLLVRRVKDGLKAGLSTDLATLSPGTMNWRQLGEALDRGWLAYMKDRPLTARGYLENQHGQWMRGQATQMIAEDEEIRARAAEGSLLPPGRKRGQFPPYLSAPFLR
jgi:hypothetical protein